MTPMAHRIRSATAAAALLALAGLAGPPAVSAATTPAVNGTTLTFTGDGTGDTLVIGESGGLLTQSVNGAAATTDIAGQVLPANNTINVVVNAAGGEDTVTATTANLASLTVDGGAGNDTVTGNADDDQLRGGDGTDTLTGGDGDDRILGDDGDDTIAGGNGNDVLVWNPGDDSDVMDGDGGTDDVELNGGNGPEQFKATQSGARVIFERVSPGAFDLDVTADRLVLNGNGGDDRMDSDPAVTTAMLLNGGTGADTLQGGGGADLIQAGEDADTLTGGPGADRLVGDRGADTMNGGDGEDTTVWNNGDGSDVMNGDAGVDRVEVNGAAGNEVFTVAPNAARAKFDRTSAGAFSLDIGSAEALDLRSLAGDDTFTASPGTGALLAVTADAGAGNDALTGAEETDTFSGGPGNDTLTGGTGADALDGQDGDDTLRARDGQGDLARGGAGTDTAQTDLPGVDVVDSIESLDALTAPVVTAADTKATAARVRSGASAVAVRRGRASTKLSLECPASEAGGCIGTVTLVSAKPVRIGSQRVIAVLGSARYALKAGERRSVTVRLPKGARKLAVRRAIAARAQTVTRDAAGNVAVGSRAVSLRFAR